MAGRRLVDPGDRLRPGLPGFCALAGQGSVWRMLRNPRLATTALHALDNARYLRDAQHADALLYRLVAHHSCAIVEASERGLADVLGLEFEPAPHALSSVLTFCNMTTSPDSELVPVDRRLAEIHRRYGQGHLASRSIQRAMPMILRAVEQAQDRAARSASSAGPREDNACTSLVLAGTGSNWPLE